MSGNTNIKPHPLLDQVSAAIICLYFFSYPWGVYELLPIDTGALFSLEQFDTFWFFLMLIANSMSLSGVFFTAKIPLALLRLVKYRAWPIPLELTWPLLAMLLLSLVGAFTVFMQGYNHIFLIDAIFSNGLACLLILLCVPHWQCVRSSLYLFSLSGTCVCIVNALSLFRILIPINWPTPFAGGALTLLPPSTLLLLCAISSLLIAFTRVSPWWMRISAFIFSIPPLGILAYKLWEYSLTFASFGHFSVYSFAGLGLMFWLVARASAKAFVRQGEVRNEGEQAAKHRGLLIGIACALPILLMLYRTTNSFGIIGWPTFFLSLLIAYIVKADRPENLNVAAPRNTLTLIALVPCSMLILFNIFNVSNSFGDSRNYENILKILGPMEGSGYVRQHFQSVNQLYPGERNTWYWIARGRLNAGDADGSVDYYLKSLKPGNPLIIKAYPETYKEEYLSLLRDAASTLEQSQPGLPYERVLFATGESAAAMSLLEIKAKDSGDTPPPFDRGAMLWALGRILGRGDAESLFAEWSDEKLYALIQQQNAHLSENAGTFSKALSLIVHEDRVEFELWQNGNTSGGSFPIPANSIFRKKKLASLNPEAVTLAQDTINTPLFTIRFGEHHTIEFNQDTLRIKAANTVQTKPFSQRFILITP